MARARSRFRRLRRAVIRLQRFWRGILVRRKFARFAQQMNVLIAHVKARQARRRYLRLLQHRVKVATRIQTLFRTHKARRRCGGGVTLA